MKINIIIRFAVLMIFSSLMMQSCYYDKKNEIVPRAVNVVDTTKADTTKYTYTRDIRPILMRSNYACLNCHGQFAQSGNVKMDVYEDLIASNIVEPKAGEGRLLMSIKHASSDPNNWMPNQNDKPSDPDIAAIQKWIRSGYPK